MSTFRAKYLYYNKKNSGRVIFDYLFYSGLLEYESPKKPTKVSYKKRVLVFTNNKDIDADIEY